MEAIISLSGTGTCGGEIPEVGDDGNARLPAEMAGGLLDKKAGYGNFLAL